MLTRFLSFLNRQTLIIIISIRNLFHSILNFLLSLLPTMTSSSSSVSPDPPPFDPLRPAVPVSYPIKTLAELESRSYFDSFHFPFNKSTVALRNRCLADRPRMLVCHDMAGGYTDDKWVQGGSNPEAYAIWHWYLMDVFVYFSHDLVTLPPPCWTNAAHKHGVKIYNEYPSSTESFHTDMGKSRTVVGRGCWACDLVGSARRFLRIGRVASQLEMLNKLSHHYYLRVSTQPLLPHTLPLPLRLNSTCLHAHTSLPPWLFHNMLIPFRFFLSRQTLISIRNLLYSMLYSLFPPTMNSSSSSASADPPPFDPSTPAAPVSYPIKTLAELESRSYFDSFHFPFNKSTVALRNRCLAERPRMLVCHDMAGGYTDDDKWVQGGSNPEAYGIWHWHLIDVFVYFSHDLVTLPPPCWTNAAHKHGVKVLGTFITEWDEGRVTANKLLATKESACMYAERLAELASALGFDGWLLNMEVKLDVGKIPILKEFVSHLTKTMHALVPGSLVIWYDSVTVDGDLIWQNQLNQKNKPFFDVSDGIFLNYSWLEDYPKRSAAVAGDRKFDVYMGIDIFGRGTYGGGQWTTNVALDVIKSANVSAALFAPGWLYETKQPPDFETAQNRWWSLVKKSWGIMQSYPLVLPFYSNFDQGRGQHVAIDGGQVSSAPWNNISSQSFQPCLKFSGDPSSDSIQVLVDLKQASYSGGGNIMFKGTLPDVGYFSTKLFHGELLLGDLPVYFTYSAKLDGNSLIGLSLEFSSAVGEKISVLLASRGNTLLTMTQFSSKFHKVIMPRQVTKSETDPGWVILESSILMNGFTLTEIHVLCYSSNPETGKLRSNLQTDRQVFASSLSPNPTQYSAILGHVSVKTSGQNVVFPPSTSWLVEGQDIKWTSGSQKSKILSVKVSWRLKDGNASLFPKYNIFVEKLSNQDVGKQEYLGVAQVEAFYVFNLLVPSGTSNLKFIIQVCGVDGTTQPVNVSPSFHLPVEGS